MTILYYKPHQSRAREATFFQYLQRLYPEATVANENAQIEHQYLNKYIERDRMISALKTERYLSLRKRQQCLDYLEECPSDLKIALDPSRVSFDFVVEENGNRHYWEFHEQQHRNLSVDRPNKVFSSTDEAFIVPRFLQRLIRDVWRVEHFQPYTVVWHDWFEQNYHTLMQPSPTGFSEYSLRDKFSFKTFWISS